MVDLISDAFALAEKERQDGFFTYTALVSLENGETLRVGLGGGGQNVAMMAGLFGEQQADFIRTMGNGQGVAAAFINMMDIEIDGQPTALLSAWEGGELILALKAPIGALTLTADSSAWEKVTAEELMKIGVEQTEAASAGPVDGEEEGTLMLGRMSGSETDEQNPGGPLTEDQRDKIFRNTIRQFRDGLSELADEESTLMLVMNVPQDGPMILLEVTDTEGLDVATVLRTKALSSVYMTSGANYGVAAWAEKFDDEGERMVVMAGAALSGPDQDPSTIRPETYSYFIDREGNVRNEELMLAQSFAMEMLQGWSLANGGDLELPFPEDESEVETLKSFAAHVIAEERSKPSGYPDRRRFHIIDWDGKPNTFELSLSDVSSEYELCFWRLPHELIKLNAAIVAWGIPIEDGADIDVTVVSPAGAIAAFESGIGEGVQTTDLPQANSVSMVIESIRTWNTAMEEAKQRIEEGEQP